MAETAPASVRNTGELHARLMKLEGQVRGIRKMVEQDRPCADVFQQIAALKSAADGAAMLVLEGHVRDLATTARDIGDAEHYMSELLSAVRRLART